MNPLVFCSTHFYIYVIFIRENNNVTQTFYVSFLIWFEIQKKCLNQFFDQDFDGQILVCLFLFFESNPQPVPSCINLHEIENHAYALNRVKWRDKVQLSCFMPKSDFIPSESVFECLCYISLAYVNPFKRGTESKRDSANRIKHSFTSS